MYAIAFLCFLLMIKNARLEEELSRVGGNNTAYYKYSPCLFEEIITKELQNRNNTEEFKVFTPKRSCFVCSNSPCISASCDMWVNNTRMNIYNNLFEFGLFSFNMAEQNIFRIIINSMCNFKVEIIPYYDVPRKTKIVFSECLTDRLYEPEKCTEKLEKNPSGSFNISKDCIFVALAFIKPQVLHYSISFNCSVIPSLLLKEEISLNIASKKCFIDKDKKNQTAAFIYKAKQGENVDGIALMLPCTSGGYAFDEQTGHIITGDTCDLFMKDKSNERGLNFLVKKLYDDKPSFIVESRPQDWDEIMSKDLTGKYTPAYVSPDDKWKKQVEITQIIQNTTALKKKARQGCKLVDAPKTTTPPPTTETTTPPAASETTTPPAASETVKPPAASETSKSPTGAETSESPTGAETAEISTAKEPPRPPPPLPTRPIGLDNEAADNPNLKAGNDGSNLKIPSKKRTTTEKQKISGAGGGADASRGSLHFLSIEIKLFILASNLGIIYHL